MLVHSGLSGCNLKEIKIVSMSTIFDVGTIQI